MQIDIYANIACTLTSSLSCDFFILIHFHYTQIPPVIEFGFRMSLPQYPVRCNRSTAQLPPQTQP